MAASLNAIPSTWASAPQEQAPQGTANAGMVSTEAQPMNALMPVMPGYMAPVAYPNPYVHNPMHLTQADAMQQQQMMQAYMAQQQHVMQAYGQHDAHANSLPGNQQNKSPRWIITRPALFVLEQVFTIDKFPSHVMRQRLAQDLGVTPRQIQVWFQNRRQRERSVQRNPNEMLPAPSKVSSVAAAAVAANAAGHPPPIACASVPTIGVAGSADGAPHAPDSAEPAEAAAKAKLPNGIDSSGEAADLAAQPGMIMRPNGSMQIAYQGSGQVAMNGQMPCVHATCGQPLVNGTIACTAAFAQPMANGDAPAVPLVHSNVQASAPGDAWTGPAVADTVVEEKEGTDGESEEPSDDEM